MPGQARHDELGRLPESPVIILFPEFALHDDVSPAQVVTECPVQHPQGQHGAQGGDQAQEPDHVGDEAGGEQQHAGDEQDQSLQQVVGGYLSLAQFFPCVHQGQDALDAQQYGAEGCRQNAQQYG